MFLYHFDKKCCEMFFVNYLIKKERFATFFNGFDKKTLRNVFLSKTHWVIGSGRVPVLTCDIGSGQANYLTRPDPFRALEKG